MVCNIILSMPLLKAKTLLVTGEMSSRSTGIIAMLAIGLVLTCVAIVYILKRYKKLQNHIIKLEKIREQTNILDTYILKEPSNQNVLNIFNGEWSSMLPEGFELETHPGNACLFDDGRIKWAEKSFGKFSNWEILELGPLEGGHSYMFQNSNARKIIAIEANTRAYLKCLCIKEIFNLDRVEFKLGDFISYLETDDSKYDMVCASGVLYHMLEPIKLLKLLSKVTDRLFIWTHYYDQEIIMNRENLKDKFSRVRSLEFEGKHYEYSSQSYMSSLDWIGFCGGPEQTSKWLTRDSIIRALKEFGFVNIEIEFDDINHQNGPAFSICASKESS